MKRTYYKVNLKLTSPLSLGSGTGENTDSDVLLDSRGVPFIPATSVAGIMRHDIGNAETANTLFGSIDEESCKTRVITYDAVCTGKFVIAVRDSVKLKDDDKVAEDTGKFDFEAVETGAEFVGYIELAEHDDDVEEIILDALSKMDLGLLRFGHKTSRGYGTVKITQCLKLAFTDVDKWLDFDMYDDGCWSGAEKINLAPECGVVNIILKLKQRGAVSVRSYTTKASDGKETAPDYEQLSLMNGTPVIPGTSWAGAFRERFCEFTDDKACKNLFGYIEKNKKNAINRKSRIYFGESKIEHFESKTVTRNSIDRYTCRTNDGALYTERTVYNGETELVIVLVEKPSAEAASALMAVIADLNNGFLSIGGLTSVGRGLFMVEKIRVNGKDFTDDFKNRNFNRISEVIANV